MDMIPDIPRLYTGLAEWLGCILFLLICRRKTSHPIFAVISPCFLVLQAGFLYITRGVPAGGLWIACMAAAVFLMFVYISICADLSLSGRIYCTVLAFLSAEFTAALEWQLHTWVSFFIKMTALTAAGILLCTYLLNFSILFRLFRTQLNEEYFKRLTWQEVFAASIIVLITFSFSNISFFFRGSPFSGQVMFDIFTIRTLIDLGGLAIMFAFLNRIGESIAQEELTAMRRVLDHQYEQYRNYQESEEMLHMMQHDLKHQIEGLRGQPDSDAREEWINTMSDELERWWIPQRTGNPVFDTILSAKQRKARALRVRVTCVADGRLLDMLHVVDICTIFGNALDNAIESVVMIPEEEKRLIHVTVSSQMNFVYIRIANILGTELREKEGILLSTKSDKKNHGYGMKGIRYVVEKYGGNVSHRIKDGWFELNILIPFT